MLLVNRGFAIYNNKRIGTIPATIAEELLGIELQKRSSSKMAVRKSKNGTWIADVSSGTNPITLLQTTNC